MSDKTVISHNREDYGPRVQMMISAMADVFWNGDLDAAWARYFETRDREAPANAEARRRALRTGEPMSRKPMPKKNATNATRSPREMAPSRARRLGNLFSDEAPPADPADRD